jgi:hypothetical protein
MNAESPKNTTKEPELLTILLIYQQNSIFFIKSIANQNIANTFV